ncbi:50S ribosomal protein L6 [candidate division NPL-UPA2 bacterium]|nr:50S ribosomal protein L6 [candidate division NPL-UPA2 bacterium]
MSRVGRKPVSILGGVKVAVEENLVTVEGPKGKLCRMLSPLVKVRIDDSQILVERASDTKRQRSLHGLTRTLIANMVEGVTVGFQKTLEIHGAGYRAEVKGERIVLQIGLSHPVNFDLPEGIEAEAKREGQVTNIRIRGIDKELVGQVAARLQALYPPDPYKGKGIRYLGETVKRKAGKAAATK